MANEAGLRRRLDRVMGLAVKDSEHGVKIAKALFAERFAECAATRKYHRFNSFGDIHLFDLAVCQEI